MLNKYGPGGEYAHFLLFSMVLIFWTVVFYLVQ